LSWGTVMADVSAWLARWSAGMAWWQWLLLVLSVPLVGGGFLTLARARDAGLIARFGISVPTVLVSALVQLALGVHAIAWTLPAGSDHPFVKLAWWWALVLACVVAVGLSVLLDRGMKVASAGEVGAGPPQER